MEPQQDSVTALAQRFGVSSTTIQKWRRRTTTVDAAMGPKDPRSTVLTPEQEAMVVAFRRFTLDRHRRDGRVAETAAKQPRRKKRARRPCYTVSMQPKTIAMSLLSALAISACSVVGIRSGTEEPHYTLLQSDGPLELRQYPPRLAAETDVAGSEISARSDGFRRLAGFIFGGNTSQSQIAMTAPVAQSGTTIAMTAPVAWQQASPGRWRIRFFMPATFTEATLPRPNDPAIQIVTVPAQTLAVYRYTGSTSPEATAEAAQELLRRLQPTPWTATATPVAWFYDPPWTIPFLRRNESVAEVSRAAPTQSDIKAR